MAFNKGWHLVYNPKSCGTDAFDYDFWHDDYCGADGGNGLAGTADDMTDAVNQIIEIEKEFYAVETVMMLSDLMNECDDLPTITMIEGLISHIEGDV